MKLKALFTEDDAVSPVIGVILMVAITVILAAVIASFVLGGLGPNESAPQASINFDYSDENGSAGELEITHDSGDSLEPSEVIIDIDGTAQSNDLGITTDICDGSSCSDEYRDSWDTDGSYSGSEISSGDSITAEVDSDYSASVIWESSGGDQTATLGSNEGPDA